MQQSGMLRPHVHRHRTSLWLRDMNAFPPAGSGQHTRKREPLQRRDGRDTRRANHRAATRRLSGRVLALCYHLVLMGEQAARGWCGLPLLICIAVGGPSSVAARAMEAASLAPSR